MMEDKKEEVLLNKKVERSKKKMSDKKEFRFNAKAGFITYPQCPLEKDIVKNYFITKHNAVMGYIAREKHVDGNYHLHCYIEFDKKIDTRNVRYFDIDGYHPNIQKPENKNKVINYCKKEDPDPLYFGGLDKKINAIYKHKKFIAEDLISGKLSLPEAVEKCPTLIFEYGNLQKNLQLYRDDLYLKSIPKNDVSKRKCYWIYGGSRLGKSYFCRKFQPLYIKDLTKWWNNYRGETYVLIEDIDTNHRSMAGLLKLWADPYPFKAEIKGGYAPDTNYLYLFVTSNYSPDDIWNKADEYTTTLQPIKYRFNVINAANYIGESGYFEYELDI